MAGRMVFPKGGASSGPWRRSPRRFVRGLVPFWRGPCHLVQINLASLGLAFSVLLLLSVNYFTEPNLAAISSTRFIVSGTLAWLAGWYFRRAARHPGPGEEAHVDLCEALYHFGVVLAIWCRSTLPVWGWRFRCCCCFR